MNLVSTSRYRGPGTRWRLPAVTRSHCTEPPLITLRSVFGPPGDTDSVPSEPGSPVRPLVKPRRDVGRFQVQVKSGHGVTIGSRAAALHRGVTVITGGFTPCHHGDHGNFTSREPENRARTRGLFISCVTDSDPSLSQSDKAIITWSFANATVWMTGDLTSCVAVRWCESSGKVPDRARESPSLGRGFQHGERCCSSCREAGTILLSMGALAKDPGPPKLGTWVSKQPLDHSSQWSRRLRSAVRVHHPVWLVRTNDQQ